MKELDKVFDCVDAAFKEADKAFREADRLLAQQVANDSAEASMRRSSGALIIPLTLKNRWEFFKLVFSRKKAVRI